MIIAPVSIAWLGDVSSWARSTIVRVWDRLENTPEWQEWRRDHWRVPERYFVMVSFEDRARQRSLVKQKSLTYYVPTTDVRAAEQMHTLVSLAQEIYRALHGAWAVKRGAAQPPHIEEDRLADLARRLP